ncbi:hypothetical protein [Pseudomonas sp.]|uniref:hypothetical protein n=1 Tax=Pseudomonas sp. TaxID=306 RepID=UPI003D0EEBB0
MKSIFFAIWALLSLLLGGAAILAALAKPSLGSGFVVLLISYCSFCLFQLIRAFYQPWGLLGPRRRTGYWLCLLLLPLALLPLQAAYEIWQQGAYVVEEGERMRFGIAVVRQGLVWLQELVGHLGPMLVLLALGVAIAVGLLRLLKTQVVR